jgi:hypothetical protein
MTPRPETGTLFGSAPPETPVYTPPPPRPEPAPAFTAEPPVNDARPPRPAGTLFGSTAPPEPSQRKGLPIWLMTVLFAGGFVALVWGVYALVGSSHGTQKPSTTVESAAARPGAPTNAWQKYVEVSGVRFTEDKKHTVMVKFVLTNHSGMDIEGLAGNVTIWAGTKKSEEEAVGTFTFKTELPANGAKDLESPLTTTKKIYELPDWQNVSPDLQVTEPGGSQPAGSK